MKGIGMKRFSGISAAVAMIAAATLAGCPPVEPAADLSTASFVDGAAVSAALAGKQLYYMPTAAADGYTRVVTGGQTELPVPTADHEVAVFTDGSFELTLAAGFQFKYFGKDYTKIVIGADGTIGFGAAGGGNATLAEHFSSEQISMIPVDATIGGDVKYKVYSNAIVVTYEGVNGSNIQGEFFIDGDSEDDIAVTYPLVANTVKAGVVGLSNAQARGNAAFLDTFVESNLTTNTTGTGNTPTV